MRADRVVSMMLLLHSRGRMTARQLAEELEVSTRTVMRDIDALGAAGIPVYSRRGPDGGFEIWDGFRPSIGAIGSDEAAAISLLGIPQVAGQLGLGSEVRRVRLKLMEALPPELANEAETITQRFHHDPAGWDDPVPSRTLTFLHTAVRRRREIRTLVSDHDDPLTLQPLGLVLKAGEWFLAAVCHDAVDVFGVAALFRYETTGRRFPFPEDFDLAAFWTEWLASRSPGRT